MKNKAKLRKLCELVGHTFDTIMCYEYLIISKCSVCGKMIMRDLDGNVYEIASEQAGKGGKEG